MKKKCLLTAFLVGCSMSMSFAHGMLQETVTDYMLKAKGYDNFHVGTIEGYPTFDTMLAKLKASGVKKVMLMPFMFVAGDHVNNDIAGDWKSNMPVLRPNTKWSISWIKRSNTLLEKTDGPNAHYPSQSHK